MTNPLVTVPLGWLPVEAAYVRDALQRGQTVRIECLWRYPNGRGRPRPLYLVKLGGFTIAAFTRGRLSW